MHFFCFLRKEVDNLFGCGILEIRNRRFPVNILLRCFMERYLPTGNEMISLPKINELTAGIEDFTYLSMQHKGLIEVRGGNDLPLIAPFVSLVGRSCP